MDSLSKKIQNLGIHDVRNAGRFMQNMLVQYEPYQIDIRRATNTDSWGPTTKHLEKVIRNKYQVPLFLMTEYILKRIIDHIAKKPKNLYEKARKEYVNYGAEWRVILKCLVVLEFLMLHVEDGEELNQILNCLSTHKQILFDKVLNYSIEFSNDGKMETHERSIKKKCEQVINLMDDRTYLDQQRIIKKKNEMKVSASGSTSSNYNYNGGSSIIGGGRGSYTASSTNQYGMSDYNANAMDSVEFEVPEDTFTGLDDSPDGSSSNTAGRARRLSYIEEQRKQRREKLREKIKQTESERKHSKEEHISTRSKPAQPEEIPDLLDMDFDSPVVGSTTTTSPAIVKNSIEVDDEDDEDDDEFGDFQTDNKLTDNTTTETTLNTTTTTTTSTTTPQKPNDLFADLFANSKSLI
ncbi:hypothetical protein TPHA_0A01500 [Tetrapisispora phaffii CBS 4417]|uniref:ENTH domain-containing protein n=1 Tax=Tetrapisispora phaffii (strain ATCC 24235 / CBS 4417 / NBRC 1672 / NRRL Y-8282 / UCD 70-5) TaxID=1071381 RepID=G8BMV5_TETPH|nr:hypothetical protein TPHA_0A01500 [Tetrapisispora phaffii CBS 4417]CCE61233.1 hypothetical protein TPHA_0A01500 [Tetrapisispora phaffii CBS 4417]